NLFLECNTPNFGRHELLRLKDSKDFNDEEMKSKSLFAGTGFLFLLVLVVAEVFLVLSRKSFP
uniref:hypothetical protein n=1 Tax=Chlorobium sp. KB01 TaxID=1917528 RepID=UPI001E61D192